MTFQDILAKYRAVSFSERDKGDRFERLMQAFLQTVPCMPSSSENCLKQNQKGHYE